jgi:hypothetical protein
MTPVQKYYVAMKTLATAFVVGGGLLHSLINPGPMDVYNAIGSGVCIYAIWFAQEKKRK